MKISLVFPTLIAVASWSGFAADPATEPAKPKWEITGQLEEACSCDAPCPCWFDAKPSKKKCDGVQVLFIETGMYGETKLDGLAIASLVESPEGESMMDSFGNWVFSYLYLDEKATPEQRKALHELAMMVLPAAGAKKIEERITPITRTVKNQDHEITIGKYGSFRGHLLEGGLGGPPKIMNPPGADPIHKEYEQGLTDSLIYNDAGQKWDYEKSNYMRAQFTVNSEQYAKYSAGLAQKMEALKKEKSKEEKKAPEQGQGKVNEPEKDKLDYKEVEPERDLEPRPEIDEPDKK